MDHQQSARYCYQQFHQDFLSNMLINLFQGLTERDLIYWPNHSVKLSSPIKKKKNEKHNFTQHNLNQKMRLIKTILFTHLATLQSVRSTGSKSLHPLPSFDCLASQFKTPVLAPSHTLILRPPSLCNKVSLWQHFISPPLFLT